MRLPHSRGSLAARPVARWMIIAAALASGALLLAGCTGGSGSSATPSGAQTTVTVAPTGAGSASSAKSSAASSTKPKGPVKIVRVTSQLNDGTVVGIGMPIVLNFSPAPTSSGDFDKHVTVTVNGKPAGGSWFWEKPYADQPVQAHYRLTNFWPAHAKVVVKLNLGGVSAGKGLAFDGGLTSLSVATGAANISYVDGGSETMRVTSDGRTVRTIRVSLGKSVTPTELGTKVVMQKGEDVPGTDTLRPDGTVLMSGPGYSDKAVQWSVRMTAGGEYVHAAPWNGEIGAYSTSDGCTNLHPADAQWFYGFARIGDVVIYTNTGGQTMPSWDGLGDWNVPWQHWQQGGLLLTH